MPVDKYRRARVVPSVALEVALGTGVVRHCDGPKSIQCLATTFRGFHEQFSIDQVCLVLEGYLYHSKLRRV